MSLILDVGPGIDTTASQGIPLGGDVLPGTIATVAPLDLGYQLQDGGIAIDSGIPTPVTTSTAPASTTAGFGPLIVVALFALWAWKAR